MQTENPYGTRVLLTGASGLLGHNVLRTLLERGFQALGAMVPRLRCGHQLRRHYRYVPASPGGLPARQLPFAGGNMLSDGA